MIEKEITIIPISEIVVDLSERRTINQTKVEELALSIYSKDLIHTVLLDKNNSTLIAGAHRIAAFDFLRAQGYNSPAAYENWTKIPARYAYDINPWEAKAIELEENIKRSQLKWEEEVAAILNYHKTMCKLKEDWTAAATAKDLGISSGTASRCLLVGREMEKTPDKFKAVSGISSAYNIISRESERAVADEMNIMGETLEETMPQVPETETEVELDESFAFAGVDPNQESITPVNESKGVPTSVICADFLEWIETYSGPKFNILHCDFPYGINHQKSEQGRAANWGAYEDSPEIYWKLVAGLCKNLDKILYPSAHVIFWFSMNFYKETMLAFETQTDLAVNPFPLIWHKTDNKGLLPDPNRGPRRIYETALFMSRGDRKVVRPVANCYGAPGTKSEHLSEKSESMLRHFMRMIVDDLSEVFDPTCGSGSALRAANYLGAKRAFGLEKDSEIAQRAQDSIVRAKFLEEQSED